MGMTTGEWKGIPSPHIYIVSRYGERSRWGITFWKNFLEIPVIKGRTYVGAGLLRDSFITGIPVESAKHP